MKVYKYNSFDFKSLFRLKGSISFGKFLKALIITVVIELVAFYVTLPEMNIQSSEFWSFQSFMLIIFIVLSAVLPDTKNRNPYPANRTIPGRWQSFFPFEGPACLRHGRYCRP